MRLYRNLTIGALLGLALPLQGAHAFTECTVTISKIFAGDGGMVDFLFTSGGFATLAAGDPNKQAC
jgi:hypothetical protein